MSDDYDWWTAAPDPATTFSGNLPPLPPAPQDNGGPLDVLHPWHPWDDDHTEATPEFTRLINQCGEFATVFAVEERERAKNADAGAPPVRRFVLPPIDVSPAALPPPPLPPVPVPYQELDETELKQEWDDGPGTAILGEPHRHRRRAANGRFTNGQDAGAA